MMRLAFVLVMAVASAAQVQAASVEEELRRLTQENLDAIAAGDVAVWRRNFHSDLVHVDEEGKVRSKSELLDELSPLPPGLVGNLKVRDFRMAMHGTDTAIVTHEDQEHLSYFGQILESRWRTTDTWVKTGDGWRLAAQQILALQVDPPAVALSRNALCQYEGTYELTEQIRTRVTCGDDGLQFKRVDRAAVLYKAEVADVFFAPGQPRTRRIFQRDEQGAIQGFVDRREGHDIRWKRVN
jgi:hypothetical protein